MGVSAILPTSTTSVPKIVSLSSRVLKSGSVDRTHSSNTPCLATMLPLQHFRLALRLFFALSSVQGKAILLGGSVRRVWLPFPRNSHRVPEEPFSVLNTLGVQLFRAFILTSRLSRFLGLHHSCTSPENFAASALCFSAFEESSRIPCNLRV